MTNSEIKSIVRAFVLQCNTGCYDPEEDAREGCADEYTGKWWVTY